MMIRLNYVLVLYLLLVKYFFNILAFFIHQERGNGFFVSGFLVGIVSHRDDFGSQYYVFINKYYRF